MSGDTTDRDNDWWKCPNQGCDGETRVIHKRDEPTVRECCQCDWSVTIPEVGT